LLFLLPQAVLLEGKAWQSRADELAAQLALQQEAQEAAAAAGGGCVLRGPEADAAAEHDIGDLEALIGGCHHMLCWWRLADVYLCCLRSNRVQRGGLEVLIGGLCYITACII
jgi:hypothetical protein